MQKRYVLKQKQHGKKILRSQYRMQTREKKEIREIREIKATREIRRVIYFYGCVRRF